MLTLKSGDLAYYSTLQGYLVPCKVLAIAPGSNAVRVKFTASRGSFDRGSVMTTRPGIVIPRKGYVTRRGSYGRTKIMLPFKTIPDGAANVC